MKHLIVLPVAVANDPRITAEAFRTLAILSTYTDEQGWCWPSLATLAARMGVSRPVIHERIASLIAAGYVEKLTRKRPNGLTMSLYRVLLDSPRSALRKLSTNVAEGSCSATPNSSVQPNGTVRLDRTKGTTTERKGDQSEPRTDLSTLGSAAFGELLELHLGPRPSKSPLD